MGTPKPESNYRQPTGNQPRGHQTVRVHRYRGPMKALLSHLPALQAQEQCSYHRIHGVLMVGNQLDRQYRKSPLPAAADKTGNGNAFFLELREQVNGVSPVGANLTVATLPTTDWAGRAKVRGKIDFLGKKRFLVFPNALVCVRVRKLNLSAPCPRGGRLRAAQTFGSVSLRDLVVLPRSIPDLGISSTLISSVNLSRKYHSPYPNHYRGK